MCLRPPGLRSHGPLGSRIHQAPSADCGAIRVATSLGRGEASVEMVLTAQTEIAVKVAIEAPERAVRKFTRGVARLMFADDEDEAG